MPQSLARLHVHLIFSTKRHEPTLSDAVRDSLHRYIAAILQNLGCPAVLINSVRDHVHILFELARTIALSAAVEGNQKGLLEVDQNSRRRDFRLLLASWLWRVFPCRNQMWQPCEKNIADQQEHHRCKTFQEGYRAFLERHRVPCDERYVWD